MVRKTLLSIALLLTAALAGCADSGESEDPDGTEGTETGTGDSQGTDDGTDGEGGNATTLGNATISIDASAGTAPLPVNFTLDAEGAGNSTAWTLDFGDGNASDGTGLPTTVAHTYNTTGNMTAAFEATDGDRSVSASVDVTVRSEEAAPPAAPETTHWEFGETVGCMEDLESTCQTYDDGPGSEGPDGHWIELGEAYWGLELTSTVDKGDEAGTGEWPFYDTDCFFTDADGGVVGEGHNGGDACMTGSIPEGTQWMYLYPYLTPALSMTVDVHVE